MNAGRLYQTALSLLTLEVYYRYLPTSSREAWNAEEEKPATPVETGDVAVDLGDL